MVKQIHTSLLLLASGTAADVFVHDDIITAPTIEHFSVCYGHTCQQLVNRSLYPETWHSIIEPLGMPLPTPVAERAAIATTISNMETTVGVLTGTSQDRGGNLAGFGLSGQMDCIDESTNTTTYVELHEWKSGWEPGNNRHE